MNNKRWVSMGIGKVSDIKIKSLIDMSYNNAYEPLEWLILKF